MTLDIKRIKAVCFDIDGTLSDTDDSFVRKVAKILSPAVFLFDNRDVLPLARKLVMLTEGPGNWFYGIADRIGWDGKLNALGDWLYELGLGDSSEPYVMINGVREMLVTLGKHYPLSIISIRGQKSTFRFLFQYELIPFFTAVATGQTCSRTKPHPAPILWAAERMNVSPSACLMIGDTVSDIQAGKRAGAQTVGVLCGFGEEKELRQSGADLVIKNTTEIVGLLLGES